MSNFFSKCNIKKVKEFEFKKSGESITIPFLFDIATIFDSFTTEYSENFLYLYDTQYENDMQRKTTINWLKDVYLEAFTFDEEIDEKDSKEMDIKMLKTPNGYIFDSHKSLYNFLINYIGITGINLYDIINFVSENRSNLVKEFRDLAVKELQIESKSAKPTEAFMLLRGALEHCVPPIFPENKGLTISEYSWREIFLQRIYLARKSEIEEILMEEAKKGKNK